LLRKHASLRVGWRQSADGLLQRLHRRSRFRPRPPIRGRAFLKFLLGSDHAFSQDRKLRQFLLELRFKR